MNGQPEEYLPLPSHLQALVGRREREELDSAAAREATAATTAAGVEAAAAAAAARKDGKSQAAPWGALAPPLRHQESGRTYLPPIEADLPML